MTTLMHKKIRSIAAHYELGNIETITLILGGLINETYHVQVYDGRQFIFQELHDIFTVDLIDDITVISEHLDKNHWICPILVRAKNGRNFVKQSGKIWRAYHYVDGSDFNEEFATELFYQKIGRILGSLHRDLSTISYEPVHKIDGFHEKDFYISKVDSIGSFLHDGYIKAILDKVILEMNISATHLSDKAQLIHGDPRLENILFSEKGNPQSFIDFDTFMLGSKRIDVGDCLRSLMMISDDVSFSHRVNSFINGYRLGSSTHELNYDQAVDSLKYITLELTLRFIIDIVEKNYFTWDSEKYKNSGEHNRDRAIQFWKLFNKINKEL